MRHERIKILIDNCDMDDESRRLFNRLLINSSVNSSVTLQDLSDIRDLRNHVSKGISENVFINNAFANMKEIKKLNEFIPNAEILY